MKLIDIARNIIKGIGLFPESPIHRLANRDEPANQTSSATVSTIRSAIQAAEGSGDTRLLFAIYRDMILSGSHVQAELNKRKLAVLAQPLNVQPADKTNPQDMRAAAVIKQIIADCDNWTYGLSHLLDGVLWPLAVSEKIYEPASYGSGLRYTLKQLCPVNPAVLCFRSPFIRGNKLVEVDTFEPDLRFWSTDEYGQISYDYSKTTVADPLRHVVHRGHMLVGVRDNWGGPMRAVLFWWYLSAKLRDWWARGSERFGAPFPVGHTDISDTKAVDLLSGAFAESLKIGGLVVDHDTQVELIQAAQTGMADNYERFFALCNREISKVIVGQTLSGEAAATGLGSGVAALHSDVREDIRMYDQLRLAETIRTQLFKPLLEMNGIEGTPPKPVWGGLSDADAKTFADLLESLSRSGWEPDDTSVPLIQERIGMNVRRKAAAFPMLPPSFGRPAEPAEEMEDTDEPDAEEQPDKERTEQLKAKLKNRLKLYTAQQLMADKIGVKTSWLAPLKDLIAEIQEKTQDRTLTDSELQAYLDKAIDRIPELFEDMDISAIAEVLEAGLGEGIVKGVKQGKAKTAKRSKR